MRKIRFFLPTLVSIALVIPVSPNYSLRQINVGSGGLGQTENYKFEGIVGENGMPMSGTAYNGGLGFGFTQMANVPNAPTVSNTGSYYNKLHITLDPSNNPPDSLFALAISEDNFSTTSYIKADHAIGSSLEFTDYLSYSSWGGSSGFDVLGLDPGKTYYVKAKAFHGDFTESGFGPTGSASTVDPQLTFDIDIHANDQDTGGPYILDIGTLLAGNVVTAPDKIWLDLETNAESGGSVFAASQNNGLFSNSASYTIPGVNGNLDSLSEGFGFRGNTASQDSGGPFVISTDFNKSGNNVSQIPQTFVTVFETAAPVVGGRGSLLVKAKSSSQTPAKNDYREVLTFIGAANF